jgi:hypothetical protein
MEQLLTAATERYRVAIACGLFAGLPTVISFSAAET